jgi:hypothetical protein
MSAAEFVKRFNRRWQIQYVHVLPNSVPRRRYLAEYVPERIRHVLPALHGRRFSVGNENFPHCVMYLDACCDLGYEQFEEDVYQKLLHMSFYRIERINQEASTKNARFKPRSSGAVVF